MKTKFYSYRQNNSFGEFVEDRKKGIGRWVIIEARDHLEANGFAEDLGLYWGGVEAGLDCGCCGDRWSRKSSEHGATEFPSSDYGQTEVLFGPIPKKRRFADDAGYVHYRDGRVETFYDSSWLDRALGKR